MFLVLVPFSPTTARRNSFHADVINKAARLQLEGFHITERVKGAGK